MVCLGGWRRRIGSSGSAMDESEAIIERKKGVNNDSLIQSMIKGVAAVKPT
jgi:hypothetical protein